MTYIILVNYNGFQDTKECVHSILEGDNCNSHIVIVDNGSTDESVQQLQEICSERVTLLCAEKNLGFSGGNNLGIQYAMEQGAEYVMLLNNDTVVTTSFMKPMLETVRKYNNKAAVTCKIKYFHDAQKLWYAGGYFDKWTSRTTHRGINEIDQGQYDVSEEVSFVSGCCVLLPVEMIQHIGLMAEDYFLYCEDTEYCCRITANGYQLVYEPAGCIYHKVSSSTGRTSDATTYYNVRNKQYLIDEYIVLRRRVLAKAYTFLENTKRIISKEYSYKAVKQANLDYRRGVVGKMK